MLSAFHVLLHLILTTILITTVVTLIIPKISVGEREGLKLNFSSMMPESVFLITEKRCAGAQT